MPLWMSPNFKDILSVTIPNKADDPQDFYYIIRNDFA